MGKFSPIHQSMDGHVTARADVREGSKAPLCASASYFRSTPINGHQQTGPGGPFRANDRDRGSLAAPPLPHHRAYGSVHGGSRSCANTIACRLGVRAHSSPRAIRCLPLPPAGLHSSAPMRSPVSTGCSAACRFRDSCPTCLSSRSGLQPSFPAQPICCLHLSATECLTSLADDMT